MYFVKLIHAIQLAIFTKILIITTCLSEYKTTTF